MSSQLPCMLGLGLLTIALESVWRGPIAPREVAEAPSAETYRFGRGARNAVLSIGMVLLWVLWVTAPGLMSVTPGFWLVLVIIILPLAIHVTRRAVEHLLRPPGAHDTAEGPPNVIAVFAIDGMADCAAAGVPLASLRLWRTAADIAREDLLVAAE